LRTRELTDRPFGLNLIIADNNEQDRALLTAEVRAAAAARVAAVVLFWVTRRQGRSSVVE
jgi:hypothetical protein